MAQPGTTRREALALIGPLALYLAHVAAFWHYVNDDAYITFRYSRLLAEGIGPYYNVGEHVEGYTNFLLMLLLAGAARVADPTLLPAIAKTVGVLCGAGCVLLTWRIVRIVVARHPLLSPCANQLGWIAA